MNGPPFTRLSGRATTVPLAPPTGLSVGLLSTRDVGLLRAAPVVAIRGERRCHHEEARALQHQGGAEETRQQLSIALNLDYTTVRHHLKVLESNRLVLTAGEKYGRVYFVSDSMEAHWGKLLEIIQKNRQNQRGAGK